MNLQNHSPSLPQDLEDVFTGHALDHEALLKAFMPVFCDHLQADRIFLQPRNPKTRVCKILRWRRNEDIPWPAIPGDVKEGEWFVEDNWEDEDPLWRAALNLEPSIYIENLPHASQKGILNLEFEQKYMFHTAFIHGHAHWPPIPSSTPPPAPLSSSRSPDVDVKQEQERNFYGSVQPAVFDGPRIWTMEMRSLVEACLVRIAPVMKELGESAPLRESFGG